MADFNWLFSTVAQSAAALVAIVAGFILSRLLALSAEKNGLQARLQDANVQVATKKQELAELESELLQWDASDFLDLALDEIVKSEGGISLREAIEKTWYHRRSEEDLRPLWDTAVATTKAAFELLRKHISEWRMRELEGRLRESGLELSRHDMKIYYRVFEHLEVKHASPSSSALLPGEAILAPMPDYLKADELNSYRQLERNIELARRDLDQLEKLASDLTSRIAGFGRPAGVGLGLGVLGYFALSILVPVLLMPTTPGQSPALLKWVVVGLFATGLLSFFGYLGWITRNIAR